MRRASLAVASLAAVATFAALDACRAADELQVAVGGRGSLIGPVLGAALVNGAKSWLTVSFPDLWLYVLGLMFILVTRYMPRGVIGLLTRGPKQ